MQKQLINALNETTNELLQTISLFTQEQFNKVPFENSWTAGQVADHVLKSESGVPRLWKGNAVVTQRRPDEKSAAIESLFLDPGTKMQAPEFIFPSKSYYEKEELVQLLKANREQITAMAATIDLTCTFTDFSFPGFGELTGIEWISFLFSHSKRHTAQLKNIYKFIA